MNVDWAKELGAAITVCDRDGVILEMNEAAVRTFAADGGAALVGANLLDCHPEPSRSRLRAMLASGSGNCYTIERSGIRKMIYQAPWYAHGEFGGLVEISIPLPPAMSHFVRT